MKKTTLAISIIFCLLASRQSVFADSNFSKKDLGMVLEAIDSICGDTWCEGDYGYEFNNFSCYNFSDRNSTTTCTLEFAIINSTEVTKDAVDSGGTQVDYISVKQKEYGECQIKDISKIEDMLKLNKNGSWQGLNTNFYDQVNACITAVESNAFNN